MVTHEMCEAGREMEGAWGYSDGLLTNIYTAMYAARPTADLGEDGELVERLRARWFDTELDDYVLTNPDGPEAADRLILYREALERVRKWVAKEYDRAAAKEAEEPDCRYREGIAEGICDVMNDVNHIIDAVLSRSGG